MLSGNRLGNKGFTILEILIASTILTIGVLGYMVVQYQSVSSRAFSKSMNGVTTTGNSTLENLRSVDFEQMTGSGTEYVNKTTGGQGSELDYNYGKAYMVEWNIDDWDPVTTNTNSFIRDMKTVRTSVKWKTKGVESSMILFTFDRGSKTGDLTLTGDAS